MATVLDTSVIVDSLFAHRPPHSDAVALVRSLKERDEVVLIPMHSFFEIVSAVMCERRVIGAPPKTGELKDLPCRQQLIPIDMAFLRDYFFAPIQRGQVIDLKGGDMIHVAVALRDRAHLITEDRRMATTARALGVKVSTIAEALNDG